MARATKTQQAESLELLRETLKPGDTVTTVLRHRASSGMSRAIDAYKFSCEDGKVRRQWLSFHAARAAGLRVSGSSPSARSKPGRHAATAAPAATTGGK